MSNFIGIWSDETPEEKAMWDDIQSSRDCHLTRIKAALQNEIEAANKRTSTSENKAYVKGLNVALGLVVNPSLIAEF